MKKNSLFCLIFIFMLIGCVTVNPTNKLASALGYSKIKLSDYGKENLKKAAEDDAKLKSTEEAKALALKQIKKENICGSTNTENLSPSIKNLLQNSLIKDLTINLSEFRALKPKLFSLDQIHYIHQNELKSLAPRILTVDNLFKLNNILELNNSEFLLTLIQPGGWWGTGGFLAAINQLSNDILENKITAEDDFEKLLRSYIIDYIDGKFVLRNGIRLTKPSGSIAHERVPTAKGEKGIVHTSLDSSTVVGLTTVILEALFDYCLETPVFAYVNGKDIYVQEYLPIDERKDMFTLIYKIRKIDDYLFGEENNNIPTAKEFLIDLNECGKENACKITKNDVESIRRVSEFSAAISKSLVGAAFKSLGGGGLSFFGFFKFSFGDNESINQIVETATSVATRRKTEHILYELLNNEKSYVCGPSEIENCANKVSNLLKNF